MHTVINKVMIIRPVVRIMIFVIRPTSVANNRAATDVVDELTWCCLLMRRWRPYSERYLVVELVRLALWLGSGLALNKYRCERPNNDDVKRPISRMWLAHISGRSAP